jgi:thiol-disulfide isomerase/thioredoxin
MKSIKIGIAFLLIVSIGLYSCKTSDNEIVINDNLVRVSGKVENYKGIYKTGKLTYFDALTRDVQDKIFTIDSLGNFDFSFNLTHPIINSIYFDVEGKHFSNFLIEPNTNYEITFNEKGIRFNGESGKYNVEIFKFIDSLNFVFGDKMVRANKIHEQGISIDEYVEYQKQFESEKLSFLNSYTDKHLLSEKIKSVLQSEIKFKTAHAWINYRFDYSEGFPKPRISLPEDFYNRLFKEYAIQKNEDFQTRVCIDYISNIVSVMSSETIQGAERIDHLKSLNLFSPNEMEMLSRVFTGDRSVTETAEFMSFIKVNEQKLREINLRYNIQLLLKNSEILPSLTRDLVISQGISRYYFANNLLPSPDEWFQMEEKIENKSILNYLKKYSLEKTSITEEKDDPNQQLINSSLEEVKGKYIDKYKGKVLYIDFYATWCGPCRQEIPYAKQLYQEFKNKDVVFLNLCAKSKKEDWENFKNQYELGGENYLLTNEEFYLLSEIYKVQGFPTYILIDKNGNVVDYSALRPSNKKSLYESINELL